MSDGREFLFSEEGCERAGVAEGQTADLELLERLESEEHRVNAHTSALRLLSHRARSGKEMRTRLAMRGIAPDMIEAEVERLEAAGLLDDGKFARSWVEERNRNSPRGRQMLRYELLGRGISPEHVEEVTAEIDDRAAATALALRKAGTMPAGATYEVFFARVGGFLRRRGFGYDVVRAATRQAWEESRGEDGGEGVV